MVMPETSCSASSRLETRGFPCALLQDFDPVPETICTRHIDVTHAVRCRHDVAAYLPHTEITREIIPYLWFD